MLKTLANQLSNSIYGRVVFAPQNDFGGGDNDDAEFDTIDGSDVLPDDENNDSTDDGDITDANTQFMTELFGAGDETDEDEDETESPEQLAEAEAALATALKDGLANLTLPQDIIPEDFDPNDRSQLTQLLNSVQINTATNAVKLLLAPVQATLTRMATQLRSEIKTSTRDGTNQIKEQAIIEEAIPGIVNPTIAPAIKMALSAARKKHPTDLKAAIAATKKSLSILGINGQDVGIGRRSPGNRGNQGQEQNGLRTGTDALNEFGLTLPRAKTPAKPGVQQRMMRRG